jgi:uncharacterized pyridoxamine 5'-phosphate oxidase family protein
MNKEEILQFLNANPACHLATVEGNQPRVRRMMMCRADSAGIVFHTGAFKSLSNQIAQNKQVEICFNSPDKQVHVAGVVEKLDGLSLKNEVVPARPFLKPLTDARVMKPF